MNAMNKVWAIGDASVDLVPEKQNSYLKCPGGASANVGVCVARLGGTCGFIGCLGDDDAGRFLRQVFQDNGVDVSSLRLDASLTSAVLIVNLTADGERSFTYLVHPGADTYVSPQDLPTFRKYEWFYFSSIGLTDSPAREACLEGARRMREAGGYVLFDVNLRSKMWRNTAEIPDLIARSAALASICKVSADELCQLSGASHWLDARYYMRDLAVIPPSFRWGPKGRCSSPPRESSFFPPRAWRSSIPPELAMPLSAACCSRFPAKTTGIMPCWRRPSAMPTPAAQWR